MGVAHNMHQSRVREFIMQGWGIGDEYPEAGITILYRRTDPGFYQAVTVLSNGKIKNGEHPPES